MTLTKILFVLFPFSHFFVFQCLPPYDIAGPKPGEGPRHHVTTTSTPPQSITLLSVPLTCFAAIAPYQPPAPQPYAYEKKLVEEDRVSGNRHIDSMHCKQHIRRRQARKSTAQLSRQVSWDHSWAALTQWTLAKEEREIKVETWTPEDEAAAGNRIATFLVDTK